MQKRILNQKGQGLIEYLIIVALIAVAGITVMKVLGQNIRAQYARVSQAIQGKSSSHIEMQAVRDNQYKSRDLSDFFKGSTTRTHNTSSSNASDD